MNGPETTSAAFDPAAFDALARVEDRHFWFRARNRLITALARQMAAGMPRPYRVLEVGCGNGNVLRHLAAACPDGLTVGMDFFEEGLRLARRRASCPLVRGDARRPPFARPFHLIGMFDVLEHLPDDRLMLDDAMRLLTPGGVLLLTVPARQSLWSYFDAASHHYRRYKEPDLAGKLTAAGFHIERISPFMCSIFPLMWLARRLRGGAPETAQEAAATAVQEFSIIPVVNEVLAAVLGLEAIWVSRGHRLPIGASLMALARKPR